VAFWSTMTSDTPRAAIASMRENTSVTATGERPIVGSSRRSSSAGEAAFHRLHERLYGHGDPAAEVEVVALRTIHVLPVPARRSAIAPVARGTVDAALVDARPAYFPAAGGFVTTPRYERSLLPAGGVVTGPCIVERRTRRSSSTRDSG
jgi:N-methylhydantoinase A/oxoprolinase/acetone carboxylase beta subunit